MPSARSGTLAVYIHWPFCESKCAYCDFNSHVRDTVDHARWRQTLLAELNFEAGLTSGHQVTSIFFGGGTPSLMQPETVATLIDAVKKLWPTNDNLEITLEANPSSVEAARFKDFAAAGINRVSLGIQALDDRALQFLTRRHDLKSALAALATAQAIFDRVSFDLIYARPEQTIDAWEQELKQALAFGTGHLSLYQLTIEPNTGFAGTYKRGGFTLPDEDTAAELYTLTQAMTADAGLPAYEISNHARPGQASRHNLSYWAYDDYVGIGPGAHGRRLHQATARLKRPEAWLERVEQHGNGLETAEPLDSRSRAEEALLMGLRLTVGIDAELYYQRTGTPLNGIIDQSALSASIDDGLMVATPKGVTATAAGRLVLNRLIATLVGA